MIDNDDDTPILASHIEQGVRLTAELHADHHRAATPYQRAVDEITAMVGQPAAVGIIGSLLVLWVVVNVAGPHNLRFDQPPFFWLATVASVSALFMTVLILTTQRRADRLEDRRAQLILQLSIVNEQKNSKIIELLERLRRDHPEIEDRIDPEAIAMTQSAHPSHVLEKLEETSEELKI